MPAEHCLAVDLGAGSGRVMLGSFDGERLGVEELHRFGNAGVDVLGRLHWDVLRLFREVCHGLSAGARARPVSLGVDTWGVDFALIDRDGALVANPLHYRDRHTAGTMEEVTRIVPKEEIFRRTGLQFMELNTLFQLWALKGTRALESASSLVMMPDLFHYWLTGQVACEYTDATTSQCFDPTRGEWAVPLLERLGLPTSIFGPVIQPGTVVGPLLTGIGAECGLGAAKVVAPGTHDTASAVAAVPAEGDSWAYLSSGTWSLLGVEVSRPHVNPSVMARNLTNEGGVCGTIRLLKNISGLWLFEECRREWAGHGWDVDYDILLGAAAASEPFRSVFDVDAPEFVAPGDMPGRIAQRCRASAQPAPETPGQFVRAIFESLALRYRSVLAEIAGVTGIRPSVLHVVGGGSRNTMLSQLAADACGIPVMAGPVEATAVGNALMQFIASGRIGGLAQGREVVRQSVRPVTFAPGLADADRWDEAQARVGSGRDS